MCVIDVDLIEFTVHDELLILVGVRIADTVDVDFPVRFEVLERGARAEVSRVSRITPSDVSLIGIRSCSIFTNTGRLNRNVSGPKKYSCSFVPSFFRFLILQHWPQLPVFERLGSSNSLCLKSAASTTT